MCEACRNAQRDWLAPPRSVLAELAFQSARLSGDECPHCLELRLEIEELEKELETAHFDEHHFYDDDRDPEEDENVHE